MVDDTATSKQIFSVSEPINQL